MRPENPVNPPTRDADEGAIPAFRAWLMEGHDPNGTIDGQPVCAWLLEHGWDDAVGEAWEAGANPNTKDPDHQGWLHWAIAHGAPTWLALEGLRRLGPGWWQADRSGHTPFHRPVHDPRLAQALIVRWWTEQRRWTDLALPFDPMESTLPQAASWRAWRGILRP